MRTYKIFKKQEKHKKQTEWPPSIKRNRIKCAFYHQLFWIFRMSSRSSHDFLTLIQVVFLGVRFEVVVGWREGGGNYPRPSLLSKTRWNYARNLKKSVFFGQISTFTQSNSVRAVLEIFQFCFQFLQDKRLLLMKIYVLQTMPSGIPLPDCSKLVANWKTSNDITIFRHDVIVNFFTLFCYFCQVQLLAQPSCHYDHWFWSYDNFFL